MPREVFVKLQFHIYWRCLQQFLPDHQMSPNTQPVVTLLRAINFCSGFIAITACFVAEFLILTGCIRGFLGSMSYEKIFESAKTMKSSILDIIGIIIAQELPKQIFATQIVTELSGFLAVTVTKTVEL